MANAINIPEYILLAEADDTYKSGDLSRALLGQIAREIGEGTGVVDFQEIIDQSLPVASDALALFVPLTTTEISSISNIIKKSDPSLLDLSSMSPSESKKF